MRISASSSGVSASGAIGGRRGSVSASQQGIGVGINIGIAEIGITTDYGGAGKIGFGGQSITWGLDGGKIQMGIAGLELIVEARNCVVVETKKIAGMIVASRSYPDPGCKLPESSEPPQPDLPPVPPQGLEIPDGTQNIYMVVEGEKQEYSYASWFNGYRQQSYNSQGSSVVTTKINKEGGPVTSIGDLSFHTIDEGSATFVNITGANSVVSETTIKNAYQSLPGLTLTPSSLGVSTQILSQARQNQVSFARISKISTVDEVASNTSVLVAIPGALVVYGTAANCKTWYRAYTDQYKSQSVSNTATNVRSVAYSWKVSAIVPEGFVKTGKPFLPTGNRPPMNSDCCKEILADLEDIKEVFAVKDILDEKMTFPWAWRMPGGKGDEIIKDYPNLLRAIAQMIDHLGIHPPKLTIKDINNAIAGDQSINNQFPSATQAFEATMAQIWDANADVDTLTNFLYRLSWLCVQQSMNLARLSGDVQALKDMLGGATEPVESSITTPFNIGAGVTEAPTKSGKGFGGQQKGKNIDRRIEANTEVSTESLLPDFLRIRENPIIVEKFSGDKDVMDMLSIIILKLESLQNR